MNAKIRNLLLAALTLCAAWLPALTHAQAPYPSKPIRLMVGYAPGGVADITARQVALKLSESLGQQVIVDNKPSAGGIVAGETVAKADPVRRNVSNTICTARWICWSGSIISLPSAV